MAMASAVTRRLFLLLILLHVSEVLRHQHVQGTNGGKYGCRDVRPLSNVCRGLSLVYYRAAEEVELADDDQRKDGAAKLCQS